jgi:hypothetical protein
MLAWLDTLEVLVACDKLCTKDTVAFKTASLFAGKFFAELISRQMKSCASRIEGECDTVGD